MEFHIPHEVESQYEGRWIAWDTVAKEVVGDGVSMEEVIERARDTNDAGHLIWYHHVLPRDSVIVGGL